MGTYKDEHKKTRVGNFLKSIKGVAPDVLNIVGDITGVDMLKSLGERIKNAPDMSKEDKATAIELLKLDISEMEEVSKRWSSDMTSDSVLSKNVRPLALIFLTLFMAFVVFTDSKSDWSFEVKESYISLLETLLLAVYLAYFGSRGIEKHKKLSK